MQQYASPRQHLLVPACGQDAALCKPLGHGIPEWCSRKSTRSQRAQQGGVDRRRSQTVGQRIQLGAGYPAQRQPHCRPRHHPVVHLVRAGRARWRRRDGWHACHGTRSGREGGGGRLRRHRQGVAAGAGARKGADPTHGVCRCNRLHQSNLTKPFKLCSEFVAGRGIPACHLGLTATAWQCRYRNCCIDLSTYIDAANIAFNCA